MKIVKCSVDDADKLAYMNKQLIEDEGSDNCMSAEELKKRMRGFLETKYSAYLFEENGAAIGYALVDTSACPLYLRQFFISRSHRGRHKGREAFGLLLKELNTSEIDLEVLSHNETGMAFWTSLGFTERSRYLRLSEGNSYGKANG